MEHAEFVELKRKDLVSTARAVLSGGMHPIAGIRQILSLSNAIGDAGEEVFASLRAIDSETDHFPVGDQRSNWDPEILKRVDEEIRDYLEDAKGDIAEACNEVVKHYGQISTKQLDPLDRRLFNRHSSTQQIKIGRISRPSREEYWGFLR